jgi:ribonucleoside-diphosphate reductase alpha chain
MGYADALLRQHIAYGNEKSLIFVEDVMEVIRGASYRTSEILGKERGIPEHCRAVNRRNITTVSIAPTGSIAFLAGCSHGIEPVFSPVYRRTDERGETYLFKHPDRHEPFFRSSLNDNKAKAPSWKEHIDVQAAAQIYVDSGVSKTINMFNGVSVDEVFDAFVYAWKWGCKGITIYRDGSRKHQVLEDIKEQDAGDQSCPTGVCEV